jgi:hypothetical protein
MNDINRSIKVRIQDAHAIRSHLESLREWNDRRQHKIGVTLNGRYIEGDLSPEHIGIIEAVREDFCRGKVAEHAFELMNMGVHVDLDFDAEEFLSAKAFARLATEEKAKAIQASAAPDELG